MPKPLGGTAPSTAQAAYNLFTAPITTKYGFIDPATGLPAGGGFVGGASQINNQNFYRRNYEVSYDAIWGSSVTHIFHAGIQWYKEMEDLYRISNGWGSISSQPLPEAAPPLSIPRLPHRESALFLRARGPAAGHPRQCPPSTPST